MDDDKMLEKGVEGITEGVWVGDSRVYAKGVSKGRFLEEVNLEIYLQRGGQEDFLLFIKVYYGRKPHYRSWVELFGINSRVNLGEYIVEYFDSAFEDRLLRFFSQHIEPGGRIFVEYHDDIETSRGLERGWPPPVTRLGHKLFELGFTWFEDWYFAEGFREGGQKLQGEKPLNEESRDRCLREAYREVKAFLEQAESFDSPDKYLVRALERAKSILEGR